MRLKLSGTPRRKATLELTEGESSFEELTASLSVYSEGEKDGPALIPALFRPCPPVCWNHAKRLRNKPATDCGGGQHHRLGANVYAMTGFGVDLDDVPEADFARLLGEIRAKGLAFWCWNTHGHQEGSGMVRARLLLPFHEPLPIPTPKAWSRGAWPNLCRWLRLENTVRADSACVDPCRIYYLPRKTLGAPPDSHASVFFPGVPLDWRAVLGSSLDGFAAPAAMAPAAPAEDPTRPVDVADYRARLRSTKGRQGTKELIGNLLAGRALSPPPERRPVGAPSRYEAWRQVTGAMAARAEDWESSAALLSVAVPSHTQEAQESPHDFTEWETIEHLFDTARAGIPQLRAEREAQREADRRMWDRIEADKAHRFAQSLSVIPDGPPEDPPPGAAAPVPMVAQIAQAVAEDRPWTSLLKANPNTSKYLPLGCNLSVILAHHPAWRGVFRRNLLTLETEMHGGPLGQPGKAISVDREHATQLANWLASQEGWGSQFGTETVLDHIEVAAAANAYDPLIESLEGFTWDGQDRLATAPAVYFGCAELDFAGESVSGYHSTVLRRWMISAVARALDPGCQVDTVLHLEGKQGTLKTSALRVLGGPFFSEAQIDIREKDSWAICSKAWIIELGELDTFERVSDAAKKRFFSLREDQFRPPYGRKPKRFPRRCVFAGTVNPEEYLSDPTGERRHWPITVGEINLEALKRDRDQLWAQAVALYKAGEQWHLTPEESAIHKREVQVRSVEGDNSTQVAIQRWWFRMNPERRPAEFQVGTVVLDALSESPSRSNETRVGIALVRMGFEKVRRRSENGEIERVYVPSERLKVAKNPEAPHLTLITGARTPPANFFPAESP